MDDRTTTLMLAGVPFVILVGIASQAASIWLWGPAHQFSYWYTGLMVVLLFINFAALILHCRGRTKAGVLIAAWAGLLCIFAMVVIDAIENTSDGYPWVILTLYLATYAVGEVVGGRMSLTYSLACGIALLATGIMQRRIDDTLPLLLVLLLVTVWSRRSHNVSERLRDTSERLQEYREAIQVVTDGRRGHSRTD
jgi:hypothetical protein